MGFVQTKERKLTTLPECQGIRLSYAEKILRESTKLTRSKGVVHGVHVGTFQGGEDHPRTQGWSSGLTCDQGGYSGDDEVWFCRL